MENVRYPRRQVEKRSSIHGVPWTAGGYVATSVESMEKCGGDVAASMESHGQLSSGYGF